MPNIVTNTMTLKGIGVFDEKFYTLNDEGTPYFDFNKIVPEPESESECIEKYGTCYLDSVDERGYSIKRLYHNDGKPWFDWYSWHCEFWGTKWNAFCLEVLDTDTIRFQTAWGAPDPIFGKLSRMFPDVEVLVHSEYEDGGIVDSIYKNGEVISSEMTEEPM